MTIRRLLLVLLILVVSEIPTVLACRTVNLFIYSDDEGPSTDNKVIDTV